MSHYNEDFIINDPKQWPISWDNFTQFGLTITKDEFRQVL